MILQEDYCPLEGNKQKVKMQISLYGITCQPMKSLSLESQEADIQESTQPIFFFSAGNKLGPRACMASALPQNCALSS
jgi:hypothetical protein